MSNLPSAFIEQMKVLLPIDFEQFEAALKTAPPTSIRFNPSKAPLEIPAHLHSDAKVPWHPNACYLPARPKFTLDPLFHAGAYYVQEASSMLLYETLRQSQPTPRPLRILDLCAAPGGKTTLIASWMPEGSLLIANEVIRTRVSVLKENLVRWGHPNVFTCSYDPEAFLPLSGWFDVVVVDAPCSGEGLFRKNSQSTEEWSPENVALCASRQRRILNVAQQLIAPGGTLIYSTCTYNSLENEQNALWLSKERGMSAVTIETPSEWNIAPKPIGYQAYPHRVQGEGFYVAALRNTTSRPDQKAEKRKKAFHKYQPLNRNEASLLTKWISSPQNHIFVKSSEDNIFHFPHYFEADLLTLDRLLPQGVWLHPTGQLKGKDLIPSHTLALQTNILNNAAHSTELTDTQALQFLKKELATLPEAQNGWNVVKYAGLPLGWVRNLGNRVNNYLPTELRIRIDLHKK